jgi:hypothetical protein
MRLVGTSPSSRISSVAQLDFTVAVVAEYRTSEPEPLVPVTLIRNL